MSLLIRMVFLCVLSLSLPLIAQETEKNVPITSGDKIAFLGDSITMAGGKSGGYCKLVIDGLKQEGIEVEGVFAGKSGHKSNQMLARLEKDVISKKPNWMTLSCGVNDVWHGPRGVKLEDYKVNIEKIIDKAQAAGIKVMVLTSTMIQEDQNHDFNQKLLPYNIALRELAKKKGCLLADLNQEMQDRLRAFPEEEPKGNQLTIDGVHMNPYGNFMMAQGILKKFGLPEARVKEFETGWRKIRGSKRMRFSFKLSLEEYENIKKKTGKDPQAFFNGMIKAKIEEILK